MGSLVGVRCARKDVRAAVIWLRVRKLRSDLLAVDSMHDEERALSDQQCRCLPQ
jgi:hypothetical protein